ncbi:MAG TPA: FAD binding domain-containing protein [Thermoplasmata archaeon]|nr:FAD binding domain-containing protein [Thermoplasmata archaeon]
MAFSLVRPASVEEALRLVGTGPQGGGVPLAGGTDLLLDLDDGRVSAERIVSLDRLPWKTLAWEGDRAVVGATLPLARLGADRMIRIRLPGLADGIAAVGSLALRHRATLGGNLGRAAPASDLLPILLASGAAVRIVGPAGPREVPVSRFLLGSRRTDLQPGELIASVAVPEAPLSAYVWQRVRPANDVSQVGVAVAWSGASGRWRVALGGVQPTPTLVEEAGAALPQERPTEVEIDAAGRAAASHARFVTDKRASEQYRRRLVSTLVKRGLERAIAAPGAR